MALIAYETAVLALIQAPSSPSPLVATPLLDTNINTARNQVAAQGECIRNYATLAVTSAAQQYPFSDIVLGTAIPANSVGSVLNVRKATFAVGGGQGRIYNREFEWFQNYILANAAPVGSQPKYWAQYGQGVNGTLFINLPDGPYTLTLDCACLPVPLADDSTPEAIPELWTDAVPYYAAWLSMTALQRQADAEMMLKRFDLLMARARQTATPSVLPHQFSNGPDPVMPNRLGITQPARGGGAAG